MKIYSYTNILRTGLLLEEEGRWGEVSPLAGWSRESFDEALKQLKAVQKGWIGSLFPSVAFGLASLQRKISAPFRVPAALLFMGNKEEILQQAEQGRDFTYAKIKLKELSISDAIGVVKELKNHFRLRLDLNQKWSRKQLKEFCSYFTPDDFEYLEDPPYAPTGFRVASDQADLPESIRIWKPTVRGMPPSDVILSSAFESGVGIAHIGALGLELYRDRLKSKALDTARQSKIETCGPNEENHARLGQTDEKGPAELAPRGASQSGKGDRFCKVAACPKLYFSSDRGISALEPIGVGTYRFLKDDILLEPLELKGGFLYVPSMNVDRARLTLC